MAEKLMPVAFLGHGSPMWAIEPNPYVEPWAQLAAELPRPKAILCISAHWYTNGTGVTAMERPRTIHDFGGFPQALFDVEYTAPGDPALAARVADLLKPAHVVLDQQWGFDHGTWCLLRRIYPEADIPVIQLSIDATKPNAFHYELGQRLAPLRDEGVLILGSGNIVHNLSMLKFDDQTPYDWARSFSDSVKDHIASGEHAPLIDYLSMGRRAELSAPTPEHYLPLLYVLGAIRPEDKITFPIEGFEAGSLSMLSILAR